MLYCVQHAYTHSTAACCSCFRAAGPGALGCINHVALASNNQQPQGAVVPAADRWQHRHMLQCSAEPQHRLQVLPGLTVGRTQPHGIHACSAQHSTAHHSMPWISARCAGRHCTCNKEKWGLRLLARCQHTTRMHVHRHEHALGRLHDLCMRLVVGSSTARHTATIRTSGLAKLSRISVS